MSEFDRVPHQPTHRRRSAAHQPPAEPPVPPYRPEPRPPVAPPVAENNRMLAPARHEPRPAPVYTESNRNSFFDGGLLQQIGYAILGALVTVLTLGICYPWALCMQYRWRIKHTVIEGRRLAFDGRATQLVGKWILWLLLCIITLGIYSFWVGIALEKWKVKHTHFAD